MNLYRRLRRFARPLLALAIVAAAAFVFARHVSAAVLIQAAEPILKPEAAPILKAVAATLPLINRYLVEWLRVTFPSMKKIDGRVLSRNVGVLLFLGFAVTGIATRPDITLPTLPTSGDAFDYLDVGATVVAAIGMLISWIIGGSRYVHSSIKGDDEGPALPPPPTEPGTTSKAWQG